MPVTLEINFFIRDENREPIPNNFIYEIRREIALMLENSEFGRAVEIDNDLFTNVFANSVEDFYYEQERELFISYQFVIPVTHGNLPVLLLQGIPNLIDLIQRQYNLFIDVRINYH